MIASNIHLMLALSVLLFAGTLAMLVLIARQISLLGSRMLGEIAILQEDTLRIVEDARDIRSDMRRLIPTGASSAEVTS